MKKISLFVLLFAFLGNAQTITVKYSEKRIISKEKLEQTPEFAREQILKSNYYNLIYSNGISLYKNDDTSKNSDKSTILEQKINEEKNEITQDTYRITANHIEKWFYKEYNNNLLLFNVYNGNINWDGKDVLLNWNWVITNETKTINDFNCRKATYNYNDEMIFTAWFTEDIPIKAGPEKFDGLPGLIIYIGTPFIEWEAISILIDKQNTTISKPIMPTKTNTLEEVYSTKLLKNIKAGTQTRTKTEGNTTTTTTTIIN